MKLIGDKAFYKSVLKIAVPVMIQNGVTNMIGLINNITVGQLGTEQLAGVSIANQLIAIFYLCIFGAVSATGIFGAQYIGKKDYEGVKHVVRLKFYISVFFSIVAILIFIFCGKPLISTFLHETNDGSDLVLTLTESYKYMSFMCIGFIPYSLSAAYSATLREAGYTVAPMRASIIGLVFSVILNLILIPVMGVLGGALATVISRFVECGLNMFWAHSHPIELPFMVGAYSSFKVPADLSKKVLFRGAPLIFNEAMWSVANTIVSQCYSYKGISALAAVNMASTITNVTNVLFMSLGVVIGILVGNLLGAGKMEEARDTDTKLIAFDVMIALGVSVFMLILGPVFPMLYSNITPEVRELSKYIIWCEALVAPLRAVINSSYYTIRAGGNTVMTALYDCGFEWAGSVLSAYLLTHFTNLSIIPLYFIVRGIMVIKVIIGLVLVKRGRWLTNIVDKSEAAEAEAVAE